MTQAQAQTVSSAIIGAGYDAHARKLADGTWTVRASANGFTVAASAVASLAAANGVTGNVAESEFS